MRVNLQTWKAEVPLDLTDLVLLLLYLIKNKAQALKYHSLPRRSS